MGQIWVILGRFWVILGVVCFVFWLIFVVGFVWSGLSVWSVWAVSVCLVSSGLLWSALICSDLRGRRRARRLCRRGARPVRPLAAAGAAVRAAPRGAGESTGGVGPGPEEGTGGGARSTGAEASCSWRC